jgi:guanosine-3',5'-bis(diphosphate) 3'-pyrophosphohydrolase
VEVEVHTMENDVVARAARFAAAAHASIDQRRKYSGEPYIVHPTAVARLVASVTEDPETLAAAWLHDVVEDTPVSLTEIRQGFGETIAGLVNDLTNVSCKSDGNRATRKRLDYEHTAQADTRAKTIKLADIIHNARDIAAQDRDFARVYLQEKQLLLNVLRDGDPTLFRRAATLVAQLKAELDG